MPNIDPVLMERLAQGGGKPVPVLVVCGDRCAAVTAALTQAGIKVTSTESAVLGSIGAEISPAQLETIKSIKGISAIEYDQEAEMLNGG